MGLFYKHYGEWTLDWRGAKITDLVANEHGEIVQSRIKLVSAKCPKNKGGITNLSRVAGGLGSVRRQLLKGEDTEKGWYLSEVRIHAGSTLLVYKHPGSKAEDKTSYIRFLHRDDIELEFEVERLDGTAPDRFRIYTTEAKDYDRRDRMKRYPNMVAYLYGGTYRHTTWHDRSLMKYRINEEWF